MDKDKLMSRMAKKHRGRPADRTPIMTANFPAALGV